MSLSNEYEVNTGPEPIGLGQYFDRRIIWQVYKKKLLYIVIISFVVMAIAGIWLKVNASPSWKAHCYMVKAPKNISTPVEMPYLYQSFDVNTVLETVKIREVLAEVVNRLNLKVTPEQLFSHVEVQRGNRSAVFRFSATWPDKEMAANIANATAEAFIANSNKMMNSATQKVHDYYVGERTSRLDLIADLEDQFAQNRQDYGIISIPHETQVKFDQLEEIEIRMIANRLRETEMATKIAEMDEKLADVPLETMHNWTFTRTDETRLLELERELELLRTRYTEENPKVIKVKEDIEDLREQIENQTRNLPEATTWGPSGLLDVYTIDRTRFEADRQASRKLDREYQSKVDSLRANLGHLTDAQKEFLELERQLELNRKVLSIIESRLAEAEMSIKSNVSDYEIIEPAKPPLMPEGTRRRLIVLGLGAAFFALMSAFVVGKELVSPYLRSSKDFSHPAPIPLLGQIPDEGQVENTIYQKNLQVFADNLLRIVKDIPHPVICVSSDIQETGKSFLIGDLLRLFQTRSMKILYIDSLSEPSPETRDYLINPRIYEQDSSLKIYQPNPNEHYAYFCADEKVFTHLVDKHQIDSLFSELKGYDLIIWELFDYEYNKQLFASIVTASEALLLVGRFRRSSRGSLARIKRFLKERDYDKVYGVLNYVPKDFFKDEN